MNRAPAAVARSTRNVMASARLDRCPCNLAYHCCCQAIEGDGYAAMVMLRVQQNVSVRWPHTSRSNQALRFQIDPQPGSLRACSAIARGVIPTTRGKLLSEPAPAAEGR
jgi:hypothetical protein